ncbi:hypothetical protein RRF57_013038 [Xylaria bambusicola]|uniref:Uncharacterized protein n=1 Tax=Xylaria bambusicola TaxID=326684 RepID=A0AAN7ZE11_9PEZI
MLPGLIKAWLHSPTTSRQLLSLTKYWPSTRGRSQGSGWSKTDGGDSRDRTVEGNFKKSNHSAESTEMFDLEPGNDGYYQTHVGRAM